MERPKRNLEKGTYGRPASQAPDPPLIDPSDWRTRASVAQDGSMMNRILAKLGLSVVLKMMLVDNLVHADLHPGNILVRIAS
eukprot:6749646-Pyramimonas_sp.AAC.1